jgi:DNA-binding NarL/FixJ family response regulator
MAKIRVVLADDHVSVIEMLRQTIDEYCEIVDTAEDGQQAIDKVLQLVPDVLVLDISMPVMDGLAAARRLRDLSSATRIVFLSMHEDQDFVEAALAAGASGYVTKSRLYSDLVPAIEEVMLGHTFVSPIRVK